MKAATLQIIALHSLCVYVSSDRVDLNGNMRHFTLGLYVAQVNLLMCIHIT